MLFSLKISRDFDEHNVNSFAASSKITDILGLILIRSSNSCPLVHPLPFSSSTFTLLYTFSIGNSNSFLRIWIVSAGISFHLFPLSS